ncbi:uncharacterized protein si:dkey-229b18.3 [Boleophthalmus pectinirostris]|uniref:uncharacterized protein si:dkey-229b18.3 n=1 Tax=Boleophthalmus pectinirostris TaxID=150288 RepID=UPI00242F8996|nr:uncharacterized protein si:dkey-229b18.3 [Boleophthalmus pectinirostris]XP_020787546.2 uncharacterized protein si:dkey-229b18.3 [Boleophthalmus pectinirostris]XP_055006972.1 uncharacterized protein si:dkey-229b18.3 [Boleophthalmus pectinirostris]
MAGDCTHSNAQYAHTERFCPSKSWSDTDREMEASENSEGRGRAARLLPHFEVIDGLLYRKKLERGFINYREVLDEDRRQEAIGTFHRRRPDQRHLSLEDTYKSVADNYWWDGMYFHIKDFVLNCPECKRQCNKKHGLESRTRVTKTMASYSSELLSRLKSQRDAGLFCDITLRTSGRSYSAHRAVLAAVSDHFQEIFNEMDSSTKADVDLTGFSEDSLVSLLEFSYSSTLSVRKEDLPEVVTLARHLGMWPAVEACSALMKEQERPPFIHHTPLRPCRNLTFGSPCQEQNFLLREGRRKRGFGFHDSLDDSFSLTLEASDESTEISPRRILRQTPKRQGHNGLPLSTSPRMKLMDFKSPSSKKPTYSPVSPPHTRLLRSTPGAAKELQRLLPQSDSSSRYKKTHSSPQRSSSSRTKPSAVCSPVRVKQEAPDVGEDEEDYERAQEKYQLMHVLGLQRTALLPRPEDLVGWRQKKRLRKLKANNYSLTKRRKPRISTPVLPYKGVTLALPLCNPVNVHLLRKTGKSMSASQITAREMNVKKTKGPPRRVPPSDRSMRSKGVVPDVFQPPSRLSCGMRELRELVRKGEGTHLRSQRPLRHNTPKITAKHSVRIKPEPAEYSISGVSHTTPPSQRTQAKCKGADAVRTPRYNSSRPSQKTKLRQESTRGPKTNGKAIDEVKNNEAGGRMPENTPTSIYNHALYKVIKEEPAEPIPVGQFCDPPSPDLGKRQSKPPIKLLDSGFLFSFCRSPGGPMGLKKEEESVDICLTRSVARFRGEESHRALRARAPPPASTVKRERVERRTNQRDRANARKVHKLPASAVPKVTLNISKKGNVTLSRRNCVILDSVHRARLKQLRGPRSQAPKAPKSAHVCPQCPSSYRDCDALMTHRLRHIEGKHWPCPLCSKTFFRLRNVRNHIRTHDPKLYKCRSCIAAGSCG